MKILQVIKHLTRFPFHTLRNVSIHYSSTFLGTFIKDTKVGRSTYIGYNTIINSAEIGNYSSIAAGVQIGGMEHDISWFSTSTKLQRTKHEYKKTYIGNNTWIGANAIIKQGVRIGDGCVIGACSFVNKNVPDNTIAYGVPIKIIRERLPEKLIKHIEYQNLWIKTPKEINKIFRNFETNE